MTTITESDALENKQQSGVKPRRKLSNLIVRLITGMVAIPFLLIVIFFGGWFLFVPLAILMVIGILEFFFMEKRRGLQNNALLGVSAALMVMLSFQLQEPRLWQIAVAGTILITFGIEFARGRVMRNSLLRILTTVGGIFYIAFPLSFLIAIRDGVSGFHWFFAYIYTTWGTDTFAYLIGNMFGKTKLAPKLSPKKTVEGAVGGIIVGAIIPLGVLYQGQIPITPGAVILFMLTPLAATAGDLFVSAVKRFFGIKDSHIPGFNIVPGHGGVLDRIDSTLWVAPVMYIFLILSGYVDILF